jgi:protease I
VLGFHDVDAGEYELLILPGGTAPAAIRDDHKVHEIVRHFVEHHKPVAAICHGPQILISAGVMKGRRATCYHSVVPELKRAGARYEDQAVVVDENLVTSREPADLPAFMRATLQTACAVPR